MHDKFLAEDIRKISDKLYKIDEKFEKPKEDDTDLPNNTKSLKSVEKTAANIDKKDDEIAADNTVTDLMTHEKKPTPLTGSFRVKELAQLLGIKNTRLFSSAFNNLRAGKLPSETSQLRELAIAFDRLLAADSSTTSKVLNQLRRIHKAT